jgi:hypothetical protein
VYTADTASCCLESSGAGTLAAPGGWADLAAIVTLKMADVEARDTPWRAAAAIACATVAPRSSARNQRGKPVDACGGESHRKNVGSECRSLDAPSPRGAMCLLPECAYAGQ